MSTEDEHIEEDDGLLPKEYTVAGVVYESSLEEDLFIDPDDLNEAFLTQPGRYAWYATAYELAVNNASRLKDDLEMAYAQLDVQVRANMEVGGVKVTEKKVENVVITHPEYVMLRNKLRDAEEAVGLLKAAVNAMYQRKECLISLGANKRAEASNIEPTVRKA